MSISLTSTAYAYNPGKQNCYTEAEELGKTVFNSPGQGVAVQFPSNPVATGGNITIDTSTGVINLGANITYRFDMHCETVPSVGVDPGLGSEQRLGFVLFNTTTNSLILPTFPMNTSGTTYYTTTQTEDVIMIAYMPDGTPPNTTTQPQTWQYPQQIQNASIGVQAISGEEF